MEKHEFQALRKELLKTKVQSPSHLKTLELQIKLLDYVSRGEIITVRNVIKSLNDNFLASEARLDTFGMDLALSEMKAAKDILIKTDRLDVWQRCSADIAREVN